jgi:hypothetical protein
MMWASSAILAYRAEGEVANLSRQILLGEKFSNEQLNALKLRLDAVPTVSPRPSALSNIATIRLRLVEATLASGQAQAAASSLDDLETTVRAALAGNPTNSFLWLMDYWLHKLRSGNAIADPKLLRMSYLLGPNESWIAVRRNPIALSGFSSLPNDLAEQALAEFAGLVRSGFYMDAANTIAGSGWAVHERLLSRLVQVDEDNRRRFAKVLESKDLSGVTVPGVDERPSRPF